MCETYFLCGPVHSFLQGTWFNKIMLCKLLQFSTYRLETEMICSAWSAHVSDIFSMDQSIFGWRGALFNKIVLCKLLNLVMRTTSTVFKILTWNLIHLFGMKCRCAWHIFRVDQSIIFCRGHDLTKSGYANFYTYYVNSFQDIDLKL